MTIHDRDPGDESEGAMSDERSVVFWDAKDSEILYFTTLDDAVEAALDDMDPCDRPDELVVRGMARMQASFGATKAEDLCVELIEDLDTELGNPDGDTPRPTEKMIAAAEALLKTILNEYEPWACEEVCSETINVKEWIQKNRPDWIKEEPTK